MRLGVVKGCASHVALFDGWVEWELGRCGDGEPLGVTI